MPADRRRSRDGLTRCTRCRRHVVAGDTPSSTSCPFCDSSPLRAGDALRSTALAGLLGLAACGGPNNAETVPTTEPTTESESGTTTTTEVEQEEGDEFAESPDDNTAVDIYGAPPSTMDQEEELEPEEDGQAEEFAEEPASPMRPMARYGRAPIRRKG